MLDDVERALASCRVSGVAYFSELWAGADATPAQRQLLRSIAQGQARPADSPALRWLLRRDLLHKTAAGYCFQSDLLRQWVLDQPETP